MDLNDSPEQAQFRREARSWLQQNLPPGWGTAAFEMPASAEQEVVFLKSWQRKLHDGGWAGLDWPSEYGGRDIGIFEHIIYLEEYTRARAPNQISMSVGTSLVGPTLIAKGEPWQKQRFLQPILRGEEVWCQGFSEPDAGSDVASLRTRGVVDGDSLRVTGQKTWTSFAQQADWCILVVRTNPEAPKHRGLSFVLLDMKTPGIKVEKMDLLSSHDICTTFFDDVRVPDANVLPGVTGLKGPLSCLTQARYGITWGVIGAAIACFEEALAYAGKRHVFGKTLAQTQTIQRRLADMARRITTARLLSLQLGRLKAEGRMHHSQVSMAKWNNVRAALDIARDARDILGAGGISIEFVSIRHMLNLESVITYEGTETIHELSVGRELTGHSAF